MHVHDVHVVACVCVCMNNHIYTCSTLFKIQERKPDRSSKEIEQRKESQNTHIKQGLSYLRSSLNGLEKYILKYLIKICLKIG